MEERRWRGGGCLQVNKFSYRLELKLAIVLLEFGLCPHLFQHRECPVPLSFSILKICFRYLNFRERLGEIAGLAVWSLHGLPEP